MADDDQDQGQDQLLDTLCMRQRFKIISLAKDLSDGGAHYLWGAEGQKPSSSGPIQYVDAGTGFAPQSSLETSASGDTGIPTSRREAPPRECPIRQQSVSAISSAAMEALRPSTGGGPTDASTHQRLCR